MFGRKAFSGTLLVISAMLVPTSNGLLRVCDAQESTAQAVSATAPGFRVVTDVFFGTQKAPTQQSLTLFSAGVAYDISFDDTNQITMVDPQRSRIVLFNKASQTQTVIDLKDLQDFIDSARKAAETSELATYLKGADKIEVTAESVSVGDSVMQYQTTLQKPRDPQMAQQYALAADALILLNGWRSGMPPFARLSFNRAVAEQQALPHEITRTTSSGKHTIVVRSLLHPNWRLSKDDERQIAEIGTMLVSYSPVTAPEFFAAISNQAATPKVAGQVQSQK
ncbi:MAG: hypothetical protein ABI557_05715 [Aureliella sp.]